MKVPVADLIPKGNYQKSPPPRWRPATISSKPKYTYSFKSEIGTFWIRPEGDGCWSLNIADDDEIEPLGHYKSPFEAADDVYTGNTGLGMWDRRAERKAPASLMDWTKKAVG
jgi:hypothetical protein